jgi:XTP/dITP diphosphohydrolase
MPSSAHLVLATHNQGKLREFQQILGESFQNIVSAGDLNLPEPEETGTTFVENAILKAKAAFAATSNPALADDSGLCVNALNGDPGLYSARWAGPAKDFQHAMKRVHEALGQATDRSAYFITVLALVLPDGRIETFEGRINGHMTWPPRGKNGHGYDPIFVPEGETRTFGEMQETEKNALSHRGHAIEKLQAWLAKNKSML